MRICLSSPHYVSTAPVAAAAAAVVLVHLQARRCMNGEVSADGGHGAAAARYPLATRSFLRRPQLRPHFIPGATAARAHCAARKWVTSVCRWGWMPRSEGAPAGAGGHSATAEKACSESQHLSRVNVRCGKLGSRMRESDECHVCKYTDSHRYCASRYKGDECHAA